MKYLLEITRGLAALWVFLFHIKSLFEEPIPPLHWLASFGYLGVPMFFVISGYVITHSAESSNRNNKAPTIFLRNRFNRIYPTFWASVIIVLTVPYIIESISFIKSGIYEWPANKLIIFNSIEWANFLLLSKVFMSKNGDLQGEFTAINAVYWTLAIEFQFYLAIYLLLYLKRYFKHAIIVLTILCFALISTSTNINYGLFTNYWPSFSIGIGLAYLHLQNIKYNPNSRHTFIVIMILICGLYIDGLTNIETFNVGFSICFGCLLFCISNLEVILEKCKNSTNILVSFLINLALIIGTMSYSIYLLHGKIYQIPEMFVRQFIQQDNPFYIIFVIIGTLILCYPFYLFVERKFLSKNYDMPKK
ncbi:MAG: peptidoglycan/LPS O-acetylase OafA/YrhL [Dokdonia sp.]|jgi:peptidoglycan/LPS O-acetylase OafA/YrhL